MVPPAPLDDTSMAELVKLGDHLRNGLVRGSRKQCWYGVQDPLLALTHWHVSGEQTSDNVRIVTIT